MDIINTTNPSHPSPTIPRFPGSGQTITPSDVDRFETPVTVYCGGGGTVVVRPANHPDDTVPFVGIPTGQPVPILVLGVMATGTTATNLVAVY
jgi:hypothetical protein